MSSESWGGTGSGWGNPVVGATALRIPAINSPNFNLANPAASPTPSWAILQSGLAYFFGLVLSGGTITGPDYAINTTGIFFYSGTPALGNLTGSWTSATGTDAFGNAYQKDLTVYNVGTTAYINVSSNAAAGGNTGILFNPAGSTHATEKPQVSGQSVNPGAANEYEILQMTSGFTGSTQSADITLKSTSNDSTIPAVINQTLAGVLLTQLFQTIWNIGVPISCTLGTVANPTVITTDSWHPVVLDANWSTLAGQPVPSYRMGIEKRVHLEGAARFNVNINNTNLNGGSPLPAAYQPPTAPFLAAAPGAAGLNVLTNGVLVAAQGAAATPFCNFCGNYATDL